MKLSFSLKGKEKAAESKPVGAAPPPLKRPAAFAGLDDDEPDTPASDAKKAAPGNAALIAQSTGLSKAAKKRMEAEQQVDSTVFQYDEVWDNIQIAKEKQKAIKQQENADRKARILLLATLLCLFVCIAQTYWELLGCSRDASLGPTTR